VERWARVVEAGMDVVELGQRSGLLPLTAAVQCQSAHCGGDAGCIYQYEENIVLVFDTPGPDIHSRRRNGRKGEWMRRGN